MLLQFPSLGARVRFRPAGLVFLLVAAVAEPLCGAHPDPLNAPGEPARVFIEKQCVTCHDDVETKGGLDLASLVFTPADSRNFTTWVKVLDRASAGEMPPKRKARPDAAELAAFSETLTASLLSAEQHRVAAEGRAVRRRLNRYEYENTVRDLLHAPWLQLKTALPEDGEAHRFNKSGEALDISHVQMARYLTTADYALRQVMARHAERPKRSVVKYHARDNRTFTGPMKFTFFNKSPERATFPVLGTKGQPEVRSGDAPFTVGPDDPVQRELEGAGVVSSTYEPLEPKFSHFKAPVGGHYRLRLMAFSAWVGPGKPEEGKPDQWWIPDLNDIAPGRRPEPVTLYAETPPRLLRHLATFDVGTEPGVTEIDTWLCAGETIRPDAARLFRSRPGPERWRNPLAEKDGQPGVVFRWLEVEGPIYDEWPTAGHRLLFGDLPMRPRGDALPVVAPGSATAAAATATSPWEVVTTDPARDAERLLRTFLQRAYRRPVADDEISHFAALAARVQATGDRFADAMIASYTAVLSSVEFLSLEEQPGALDDHALASRLALFLTNSAPDNTLRALASRGELHRPEILRAQTDRLLDDPRSRRFTEAFLDYWLDLRRITTTGPDSTLYPDYYLDDYLAESALAETRLFFDRLVRDDLPARNIVSSDFVLLNDRLAQHYGLPPVEGAALRPVTLPAGSPRGGLLTQAAVLKVTANGTTTSPVTRGAWIMERILGQAPPPPPPGVPAIEPDIRGAHTVRQLLEQHRADASCAGCHARFDPAGFALENFDVMGGWRERYRAMGEQIPEAGIGKNGQKFPFHLAQQVDSKGELPDGRTFEDIRGFKQLLLADEAVIARNLVNQLVVYATGEPVRFGDRAEIGRILDHTRDHGFGVRTLLHEIIQSPLFTHK